VRKKGHELKIWKLEDNKWIISIESELMTYHIKVYFMEGKKLCSMYHVTNN